MLHMKNKFTYQIIAKVVFKIHGRFPDKEARLLYKSAECGSGKGVIVEIGSFLGKSATFLASGSKCVQREKVYAIDPHLGGRNIAKGKNLPPTYNQFLKNIKKAKVFDWIYPIRKYSEDAAKTWKLPIRLLYIDGDHTYPGVSTDVRKWLPFVTQDGIIAFHDVINPDIGPVKAIINDLIPKFRIKNLGFVGSIFYCQKGKPDTIKQNLNFNLFYTLLYFEKLVLYSSLIIPFKKVRYFMTQYIVKRYLRKIFNNISNFDLCHFRSFE